LLLTLPNLGVGWGVIAADGQTLEEVNMFHRQPLPDHANMTWINDRS
jgi:hypothetical protein